MSRTMTEQEYKKFKKFVDKKNKEIKSKEDSIAFLHKVGYCDKKGNVIFPYK